MKTSQEEIVESLAYAIDIIRDCMQDADTREGRASGLYQALFEAARVAIRAKAVAMGAVDGRSAAA